MARRSNPTDIAFDSIKENLEVCEYCLQNHKGMPAFTLLLTSIDAIGTFYREGGVFNAIPQEVGKLQSDQKEGPSHMNAFKKRFGEQVKDIPDSFFNKNFYGDVRSKVIHNCLMRKDYLITDSRERQDVCDKDVKIINLFPLYRIVDQCYSIACTDYRKVRKKEKENIEQRSGETGFTETVIGQQC